MPYIRRASRIIVGTIIWCWIALIVFTGGSLALAQNNALLTNGDFETGDMSGWQVTGDAIIVQDQIDTLSLGSLHTIGAGRYAARIGDEIPWADHGPQESSISQEVTVPKSQSGQKNVLQFAYAVVANDPPSHAETDKPAFQAIVTNLTTGQTLFDTSMVFTSQNDGKWYIGGGPEALGRAYAAGSGDRWVFRPWTPVEIDLQGMDGNRIKIDFTVRDCNPTAHAAYGYLDAIHVGQPQMFTPPPLEGNPQQVQYEAPNLIGQGLTLGEQKLGSWWWLLCCLVPLLLALAAAGVMLSRRSPPPPPPLDLPPPEPRKPTPPPEPRKPASREGGVNRGDGSGNNPGNQGGVSR